MSTTPDTAETRPTATPREAGFGRVFGAIWGSLLLCALFVVLTAQGSDLWAIPLTLALAACLAVIMRELAALLDDRAGLQADGLVAPAPSVVPAVAVPVVAAPPVVAVPQVVAAPPVVAVPRSAAPRPADAAPKRRPIAHV